MARSKESGGGSERNAEKVWRFFRDINALGAVALGAAGIIASSGILTGWAALNAGQAGFFEMLRQNSKKRKRRNK